MTSTLPETSAGRDATTARPARSRDRREALRRSSRQRVVRPPRRSLPVAAVTAAAWAALVGLLVCCGVTVLAWTVSGHGGDAIDSALRTGGLAFTAAHHVPISTVGGTFSLLPLGLLIVPLVLLYRGGRWAARVIDCSDLPDAALLTATGAATYAVLVGLVSTVAVVAGAQASIAAALIGAFLVATVGLGAGVLAGSVLGERVVDVVSPRLRTAAVGAAAMLGALVVVAALVGLVAVATHLGAITTVAKQLAPGAADGAVLCLLGVLYVPTFAIWTLAYLTGSGFALGGNDFSPFHSGGGLVPAFPLLAATPDQPPSYAAALLALPVIAGAVGGWLLVRRARRLGTTASVLDALLAAGLTGLAVMALSWLSAGSLGGGRLASTGPAPLRTALLAAALVALGALPTVAIGAHWPHVLDLRTLRAAMPGRADKPSPEIATPPSVRLSIRDRLSAVWARIRPLLHHDGD